MSRKVLSRKELIIIGIIAFALLLFGLQKCGVDVVKTAEESEIIDHPHSN